MPADLSVIIPTLNEEANLPETLRSVESSAKIASRRVKCIVADGGSMDATVEVAHAHGARVIDVPHRQRAAQMNAGAKAAEGEALLFLHADTRLPGDGIAALLSALEDPEVVGGCFSRRFDSPSHFLRATCWLADWRSRLFGWNLGDQAIFCSRSAFEAIGGFPEIPMLEDLQSSIALRRTGRTVCLPCPVLSSARRFGGGAARRTLKDLHLTLRWLAERKTRQNRNTRE